jgi:SOS-response transcriptional repressor LexA
MIDRPPLTARQAELIRFMAAYQDREGRPPTIREIGEAMGIKSPNGVSIHLKELVRKGVLVRCEGSRNYRVADGVPWNVQGSSPFARRTAKQINGEIRRLMVELDEAERRETKR